ncbi:MAG: helix-turn-helix transcriptional regulator [Caulobacteraceae bacterium]
MYEATDEEHQLSANEIVDYFAGMGVSVNRRTIMNDIDILSKSGLDIIVVKSSQNRYFWGDRHFQLPELKLLVDAVASSKFITEKKSEELIKKISSLASKHQSTALRRHLYVANRVKPDNEDIYYIVDSLNDAITNQKKVQFKYFEYTPTKKKVFRNNGELYVISPYALLWNEDHYYMIGYSEKHEKIVQFRIDRMYKPKVSKTDAIPAPAGFNIIEYSKKVFKMYDGEETTVELACDNSLMKVIVDHFGEDFETHPLTATTFKAKVSVCTSPTFYGWIFQFGGQIKILSPASAKQEFEAMLKAAE